VDTLRPIVSDAEAVSDGTYISPAYAEYKHDLTVRKRGQSIALIITALLLLGGTVFTLVHKKAGQNALQTGEFSKTTVSLDSIPQITESQKVATLRVNGQLQADNSIVLAPTSQPTSPTIGQIYFDQTSKQLRYYDGNNFNNLGQQITNITNNTFITQGSTGPAVLLQTSSPGSSQSGNFAVSGVGIASVLQGTSSVITPSLDAAGGALSIGAANAGSISIGKSGITVSVNGALSVAQNTSLSGDLTVSGLGNVAFQHGADFTVTGISDDVDFGTGSLFRLNGASGQVITGIAGGTDGRIIRIVNAGPTSAMIANDSTNSQAGNRITTGTGTDITVPSGASVSLVYDNVDNVWRNVGVATTPGGGGSGSYVNLQASTPGTADAGNFNITGTGRVGALVVGGNGTIGGTLTATNLSGNGSAVTNVDAVTLQGHNTAYFNNASNLSSGTVASSLVTGSYTGITAVGTLTGLTVNGSGSFTGTVSGANATLNNQFVTLSQLNSAVGGVSTVSSLNTLVGGLTLQGTVGQITVTSNGTNTLTLSLNSAVTLQGNTFNGAGQLVKLDGSGFLPALNGSALTNLNGSNISSGTVSDGRLSSNVSKYNDATANFTGTLQHNGNNVCDTSGNCTGVSGGSIGGGGTAGTIAVFSGSGFTIANSLLAQSAGTVTVSGNLSATNLSGNGSGVTNVDAATLQGHNTAYFTNASNLSTGTVASGLISGSYTGITAVGTLTGLSVNGTGAFTGTVSGADAVSNNQFVTLSQLNTAIGGVGGGVTALNALSGALNLQGTSGQISVSSNGTDTLTLAVGNNVTLQGNSFNGASQLVQLDGSGFLPALNGSALTALNASNLASGTVASGRISGGYTGITAVGTLTGLNVNGTGAFTGTVSGADAVNNNDFVTKNQLSGAVGGVTPSLQDAYDNSSSPASILLDSTRLGITIKDATTTVGGNLLTVQNNAGTANYLAVTTSGASVVGTFSVTGSGSFTGRVSGADAVSNNEFVTLNQLNGAVGGVGSGVTTVGALDGGTYSDDGASIGGTTIYLQSASATHTGLVNYGVQTFGGDKTFADDVIVSGGLTAATLQGDGSAITNLDAGNLATGTIDDARLSPNVAKYADTTANFTGDLQQNGDSVCTTAGNCTGVSGGAIGGSGTAGKLAVFTGSGFTIGDSLLSQSGATVTVAGTLAATNLSGNGSGVTNVDAATLQGHNTSYFTNASNLSSGTVSSSLISGSYSGITAVGTLGSLNVTGTGAFGGTVSGADAVGSSDFVTLSQLNTAIGGVSGVSSLNSLVGGLTLQGTSGKVSVSDNGTDTLTLDLDASVTLQGNTFNGINQLVKLDGSGFLPALNGSALTNLNASALTTGTVAGGLLSGSYTGITAVGTLASLNVTGTGAFGSTVSGADAVGSSDFVTLSQLNTAIGGVGGVSSLNSLSGALTVQGTTGQITVSDNGTDTLTLALDSSVTLQGNTFNGASQLVQLDGSGFLPALNGSALTALNASNLASGTVNDSRLSANVALYNAVTANFTGTLQHAGNNVCDASNNCGYLTTGSASTSYVQLQATTPGTAQTGNLNISGAGIFGGVLTVGSTATFNGNVTVSSGNSLALAGGITGTRPASPTEGTLYYDTTTKQLLVYANGKWQGDRSGAILVAASNSSQADKDAADYVATGTSDQTVINSALTAADPAGSGRKTGKVLLLGGTFTINNAISVPDNTTLAGQGSASLIQFANLAGASRNMITNTNTTNSVGVIIRDLKLDGNKSVNTTGTDYGIYLNGTGNTSTQGALVTNVWVTNVLTAGIYFDTVYNTNATANFIWNNGTGILTLATNKSAITNNNVFNNSAYGVNVQGGQYTIVTGNEINTNTSGGVFVTGGGSDISITVNNIYNNGGTTTNEGIVMTNTADDLIASNHIIDSACSSTCYALDLTASNVNRTTISNNNFNNAVTQSINDLGTNTIYNGQTDGSGNYLITPASGGSIQLQAATNVNGALTVSGNLLVTNAGNVAFQKGTDFSTTGSSNNVNFGTGALFRLTGASAQTITGIAGGTDGRRITLVNAGANAATIANNSASSTAANRITTGTGANISLASGGSISLVYDSGASLWRVIGTTAVVAGGTNYVTLQGSTPGTADTGNFNISGTGIAATLQGSTSVLTPLLDTASAAALSIGTSTATSVSIGKSGAATTVNGTLTVSQTATFSSNLSVTTGNITMGGDYDHTLSVGTATNGSGGKLTISGGQATPPTSPTIAGQTITYVNNASSAVASYPASIQAGDILVMTVGHPYAITNPSGWTVQNNTGEQANTSGAFYTKVASAGDIGGSVTINFRLAWYGEVMITAVRNVSAVHDFATFRASTGGTSQAVGPIAVTAGDMVVYNGMVRLSNSTVGITTGTVDLRRTTDTNAGAMIGHEIAASTGTLSQTFTVNSAPTGEYFTMISLTPSATANGGDVVIGGGGAAAGGTSGNVIIKNGGNSITAFQVQNASGTALLTADTSGMGISVAGTVSVAGNLTVTNAGNVAFQKGTDFSTTGSSNDVNFGTGALFRLTGASAQTITGIVGGADGRMITLINAASQAATISNNSVSSSAANRIITGTGSNLSLAAGASINIVYDSGASLWRVIGSASSNSSYITLQGSTPGTADTGNFNVSGTGIAANLQGTTSVKTALLDTVSAGALNIGTSTATSINIGGSGVTSTFTGTLVVGSAGNTVTLSATGIVLSGNARNAKVIRLPAEYAGAVLDTGATGNNTGTMTSGYDQSNRMNYYKWTTTQVSNQTYDVVVQVPIPKDFDSWNTNPVQLTVYTSDTTNGTVTVQVIKPSGSADSNFTSFQSATPGSTSTWTVKSFTALDASGYTAGDYLTIRIRMQSPTSGDIRIGNLLLNYLSFR
jgi:hypothetical protein